MYIHVEVILLFVINFVISAPSNRIFGGYTAKQGQYPYTVTIKNIEGYIFGGSLISTNVVLTVASEVIYKDPLTIYMGTVTPKNQRSVEGIVVNSTNYLIHPRFDSVDHENDISLIYLPGHFYISGIIEPIRLPAKEQKHLTFADEFVTLTGVGMSAVNNKNYMQFLKLQVISNEDCAQEWTLSELYNSQLCTISKGRSYAPCHGDQGGPLVIEEVDGIRTQIGVSSLFNCGRDYPHIYTRISNYIEWIAKNNGPPIRKGEEIYN